MLSSNRYCSIVWVDVSEMLVSPGAKLLTHFASIVTMAVYKVPLAAPRRSHSQIESIASLIDSADLAGPRISVGDHKARVVFLKE